MTEAELQRGVIELARVLGWRVAHFRPALTEHGYRTAVQGDGRGFPDLVLVKPPRLMFVELKADRGSFGPDQAAWLGELELTAAEVYVWRPAMWASGEVEARLR